MKPLLAMAAVLLTAVTSASASGLPDLPADVFANAGATLPKLPADVFAATPDDDLLDLVVFGAERIAVVRTHVKVVGKGYRTAWGEFLLRLHAYLDRDNDGLLTIEEANRAPWTQILQNPFNGANIQFRPGMKAIALDSNPKNGWVSLEELAEYLKQTQSVDAIDTQPGPPPDPRTESVFDHLDRDADKALSPAELAATDELVARLDRDEDEVIAIDELTPDRSTIADRFGAVPNNTPIDPATSIAVALKNSDVREAVAARILKTYFQGDKTIGPKNFKIGPEPLGATFAAFAAADSDGDGKLNASELNRYLERPIPHLEVVVSLPKTGQGAAEISRPAAKAGVKPSPYELAVSPNVNGMIVAQFEGSEIELRAADAINQFGNFFENQFQSSDADKNGVLDLKEARGNFFLNRIFPVADRNGDGKMTKAELDAYFERSTDASVCRTVLTVADRGVALHDQLDADHDTRLSVRELRKAKERLDKAARDAKGRIALSALPRRSQLTLGRGDTRNQGQLFLQAQVGPRQGNPAGTPAWFVGMDRNADGDVSPREFLGSPEHFRAFDTDGDGLIEAAEAAKAP